jgi:hypothetical protein
LSYLIQPQIWSTDLTTIGLDSERDLITVIPRLTSLGLTRRKDLTYSISDKVAGKPNFPATRTELLRRTVGQISKGGTTTLSVIYQVQVD